MTSFRDKLIKTLQALEPLFDVPGVLVVGSEVPNLLEVDAASTMVVSQDVDIGIPVSRHSEIKERLGLLKGFEPSEDEPSVWVPDNPHTIEVNFLGMDSSLSGINDVYVFDDAVLPLLVFGGLSLLDAGEPVSIGGLSVPVPKLAGLLLEKLLSDRSSVKGDRDRLVALGLVVLAREEDINDLERIYLRLMPEQRYAVRSQLTVLSLMDPLPNMPDPQAHREGVAALLRRLERSEHES